MNISRRNALLSALAMPFAGMVKVPTAKRKIGTLAFALTANDQLLRDGLERARRYMEMFEVGHIPIESIRTLEGNA